MACEPIFRVTESVGPRPAEAGGCDSRCAEGRRRSDRPRLEQWMGEYRDRAQFHRRRPPRRTAVGTACRDRPLRHPPQRARIAELSAPAQVMAVVKADAYGHGALPVAKRRPGGGRHLAGHGPRHRGPGAACRRNHRTACWPGCTPPTRRSPPRSPPTSTWALRLGPGPHCRGRAHRGAAGPHPPEDRHRPGPQRLHRRPAGTTCWPRPPPTRRRALLRVVGVFSHLAVADEPDRPETDEQLNAFRDAVAARRGAPDPTWRSGTSPTPRPPSPARTRTSTWSALGLGIYGLSPVRGPDLRGPRAASRP